MAIDWGTVFSGGVDLLNTYGQMTSSQLASSFVGPQTTVGTITQPAPGQMGDNGRWVPGGCKKRRRRRPILTQTDIGILFQISTLPNNANVRTALARSIRR